MSPAMGFWKVLRYHGWPLALLLLGALWTCWPMATVTWWDSHDTIRYPLRLSEYQTCWQAGNLYPRWAPDLLGGCGYPFFNFYGPSVFFLSAALCLVTGSSQVLGLKLAVLGLALLGAVTSYAMAYGECAGRSAAMIGAGVYVFLPYRCTDLYERGNLSEYAAYAFLPLAVWGYRGLLRSQGRQQRVMAAVAALGHAGVLLGHALIGFSTTGLVGLYLLYQASQRRKAAWMVLGTMAMACCLSAIYVMPAFCERHLIHSERTTWGPAKSYLNTVDPTAALEPFFTPGWPFFVTTALWLWAMTLPGPFWTGNAISMARAGLCGTAGSGRQRDTLGRTLGRLQGQSGSGQPVPAADATGTGAANPGPTLGPAHSGGPGNPGGQRQYLDL